MAIMIAVMLFFASAASTQISAQNIQSLDNYKTSLEPSTAEHVQSLVTDLLPSVFLSKGEVTTYGTGDPLVVYCDATSIHLLYESNSLFKHAEMLRMKINAPEELPSYLDIAGLHGFENLKYIFFQFTYNACGDSSDQCLGSKLGSIIVQSNTRGTTVMKQVSPQLSVIYQLSMIQ